MPNFKTKLDQHNHTKLQNQEHNTKPCNCRNKNDCPLDGDCRQSGLIYQATVTTENRSNSSTRQATRPNTRLATRSIARPTTEPTAEQTEGHRETYIGLTDTEFKLRYANHKQSFRNRKLRNATELSKHIWTLKEKGIEYQLKWKIVSKAKAYTNVSKKCNLCLEEKYYIITHPEMSSLNQRTGIINSCRHRQKFTLSNHPT